jgi:TldD protein
MPDTPASLDPTFLALPLRNLADAALSRARALGAGHADFRLERVRSASLRLRDARPSGTSDSLQLGYAVRVVLNGAWGFAAGVDLTPEGAARVAEQAVAVARISAGISTAAGAEDLVELAEEPVYGDVSWVSSYEVNPFEVPDAEKAALLAEWSSRLLGAQGVSHVTASLLSVQENKFYADTAGTITTQQRIRLHPDLEAVSVDEKAAAGST